MWEYPEVEMMDILQQVRDPKSVHKRPIFGVNPFLRHSVCQKFENLLMPQFSKCGNSAHALRFTIVQDQWGIEKFR